MFQHLQDRKHYEDLYDRHTVEHCRDMEKRFYESFYKNIAKKYPKTTTDSLRKMASSWMLFPMYFEVGNRYKYREKTIEKWMDDDRRRDEKLTNTPEPTNVRCRKCDKELELFSKDLEITLDDKPERIRFWFGCRDCKQGRSFYDDGEERDLNHYCPECSTIMVRKSRRIDQKATTTYTCPNCKYGESDWLDLEEKEEDPSPDPKIEKRFATDKARFCLSPENGQEYLEQSEHLKNLQNKMKGYDERKELYKELAKLQKLNVAGVRKLLTTKLEQVGYIKFDLGKPDLAKDIIVEFTVQDRQEDRAEYDSRKFLKEVLDKALLVTNWSLMSDGIMYRMGFLTGRLKGLEGEEELLKLIQSRNRRFKKSSSK